MKLCIFDGRIRCCYCCLNNNVHKFLDYIYICISAYVHNHIPSLILDPKSGFIFKF